MDCRKISKIAYNYSFTLNYLLNVSVDAEICDLRTWLTCAKRAKGMSSAFTHKKLSF